MTEGADASPDPGRDLATPVPARRGWTAWRVVTPLAVLASGALFAVSALNSGGTDLRPGRYTDLASLVRADAGQVDGLKKRVADLNDEVTALSRSVGNKQVARVNRRTDAIKAPAGLTAFALNPDSWRATAASSVASTPYFAEAAEK